MQTNSTTERSRGLPSRIAITVGISSRKTTTMVASASSSESCSAGQRPLTLKIWL